MVSVYDEFAAILVCAIGKRQAGVAHPPTGVVSLKHIYHIAQVKQMHEKFKYHTLQELCQLIAYRAHELRIEIKPAVDEETVKFYIDWR